MAEIKANKISTAKATAFRVKKSRLDTDAEDFEPSVENPKTTLKIRARMPKIVQSRQNTFIYSNHL